MSNPKSTVAQEIDARILHTDLARAMKSCGRYQDEREIIDTILDMRSQVRDGEDPNEILHDEGFEPDYIFDLF